MNKIKKSVDKTIECSCIIIFVTMVLLVAWQVFSRYVLNDPSSISETLTRYLFVWIVIISATFAFGNQEHMCISYLKDKLSIKKKTIVNMAIELITMVFAVTVMVYGGINITLMQMVHRDPNLNIPTGVIYSIIPICGVIMIFYCIYNLIQEVNKLRNQMGGN